MAMPWPKTARPRRFSIAVSLVLALTLVACTSAEQEAVLTPAGVTVVLNATVHTVDADLPLAESFAFDADGVIIAVGAEEAVREAAGDDPTVLDVEGATIVPGFQDAHVHVPEAGINTDLCFLPPGLPVGDYEALVIDCAAEENAAEENGSDQGAGEWFRAAGPSLFEFRESDELPIDVLDRALPDRPAVILDDLGHAVWTNSKGLEAAGIAEDAPDPQGGVLHRDPASGRLTGLLLEDAQQLVRNAAALDDEANYQGLLAALDELAANGVTSVSDAGGYWAQNHPAAWERALDEGALTVRAANSLYVYPDMDFDVQLAEFEKRFDDGSDLLRFDTAKVYVDGILDLGTAALLQPYDVAVDPLYPSGFRYFQQDQLTAYVSALHELGYRVNFHTIGDAAVRDALDAVESIADSPDAIAARRHRTTHTYLIHPDDLGRFSEIGVVADFQQSADAIDPDYHLFLAEFIGDRAFDLIPVASALDAEAPVVLSSDWDAGPLPPLGTIQRSLTRQTNAVPDVEIALALATIDAAYALGHEDRTGSITVGKYADFAVLSDDLFEVDPSAIDAIEIVETYLAGVKVY